MAERRFKSRFGKLWSYFERSHAYKLTFNGSHASQVVLADLCDFCRGLEETFAENARVDAYQQGRRSVWLRITRHLNLSDEQYMALMQGRMIEVKDE